MFFYQTILAQKILLLNRFYSDEMFVYLLKIEIKELNISENISWVFNDSQATIWILLIPFCRLNAMVKQIYYHIECVS